MKKILFAVWAVSLVLSAQAQVTRLSNNTSFDGGYPIGNTKLLLRSGPDKTIWAYDAVGASFVQLHPTLQVESDADGGLFNGKYYFAGKTADKGLELWTTDGTVAGTALVKDINPNSADGDPQLGFIIYNNELYFTANDGSNGRELWKTNGTEAGTVLVKNINSGSADAFGTSPGSEFAVVNNKLIFVATTGASDDELYVTDGSSDGTSRLLDIYTGDHGSHVSAFASFNNSIFFTAFDEVHDHAIWKTDGTLAGTSLVADPNPDPPFVVPGNPPFYFPSILPPFFNFQGSLYFAGNDGTNGFELWKTNGTNAGTEMVKDIYPGSNGSPFNGLPLLLATTSGTKFFFRAISGDNGSELWQSDGTTGGTTLLKDIVPGALGSEPIVIPNFSGGQFQGGKFFFIATTPLEGQELYVSDGTATGTVLLKDILTGGDGIDLANFSLYPTSNLLYFTATNTLQGNELWQTDGSPAGTTFVADVNSSAPGAGSDITFASIVNNTLFFFGTDGDNPTSTDFFKLDGSVSALPLFWANVEARPVNNDVVLTWQTAAEELTNYFVVQRSSNGSVFEDLGKVQAVGTGANSYRFVDAGAMTRSAKRWYYRIRYVDKDSKSAFSRVMTVTLNSLIATVDFYPNPVRNELRLKIEALRNQSASLRIVDPSGKTVYQRGVALNKGSNVFTTDASGFANGVYLLQLVSNENVSSFRFMVQH